MSCAVSSSWDCKLTYSGVYYGTMSLSGTITGDDIPRASTISSLTSSVEVNGKNSVSVTVKRAVSSYTHTVKFSIGNYSKTLYSVATSTSFVIPIDWLEAIPSSVSGTAQCVVTTYDGSRVVGSNTKSFTITCPSNIVPTMDAPVVERIDNSVPAEWDIYLQNVSGVKISASNAQGIYDSAIKEYSISCAGFSSAASSLTIEKIPNSGDVSYTVTAKDSRGRTVTKTGSITVTRYDAPVISSLNVFRCDALGNKLEKGTYLSVTANVSFTVINGQNVPEIVCYVSEQGGGEIYSQVIENGTPAIISNVSTDRAYDIRVAATDMFSSGERFAMISTTRYYIHFKRGGGLGIAFGKAAEQDGVVEFDDALDILYKGALLFDSGENENGSYLKFPDGTAICMRKLTYTGSINSAEGSMFYGKRTEIGNYPISFVEIPFVFATSVSVSSVFLDSIKEQTQESFGTINFYRAAALTTSNITVNVMAIGKWK